MIFNVRIPFEFEIFILGKTDFHPEFSRRYLLGILLAAGKKAVTRKWLQPDSPTVAEWKEITGEIYKMEKYQVV